MLNLYELEHLSAFAELGTLSKVSEKFHISTPTITRSMQHLEEEFGVSLFNREKNKISLNENGLLASQQAKKLLESHDKVLQTVRDFDRNQKVLRVKSCAPAPLWTLIPKLSSKFSGKIVESQICSIDEISEAIEKKSCHIAILPYELPNSSPYCQEQLYISVKKEHELASYKSVSFSDINGFNFLLRSEIGFWDNLCREKMPNSRFLVQNDNYEYDEIASSSMLPCFATDLGIKHGFTFSDRINIPIKDKNAKVTFYLYENL